MRSKEILTLIGLVVAATVGGAVLYQPWQADDYADLPIYRVGRGDLSIRISESSVLESANNLEIKSEVGGKNTITWLIKSGTFVQPGDLLCTLDSLQLEDQIHERTKFAHAARSSSEHFNAQMAAGELRIKEYLEGRFPSELRTLEKDLVVLKSELTTAQNLLAHAIKMKDRGYVSDLEVQERKFAVQQAELNLEVKQTEIVVLKDFTKNEELVRLEGDLAATREEYYAERERAKSNEWIRDRAVTELAKCEIRAERAGLVIRPEKQKWEKEPIDEGTEVWKTQTVLLMPDLSKMQVKIGVHESLIDRISPGLEAVVRLPDQSIAGVVDSIAPSARPAGWWTGNVVRYDTFIRVPSIEGLRPGTSAEVEVILAHHKDVLVIPVNAVLEIEEGCMCWVMTEAGPERRRVRLGDTNDLFVVVEDGLVEGERIVVDPQQYVEDARVAAAMAPSNSNLSDPGYKASPGFEPQAQRSEVSALDQVASTISASQSRSAKELRAPKNQNH